MEGKSSSSTSVKPIAMMLIAVLVLGMFVEQNEAAGFGKCYAKCMLLCYMKPHGKIMGCAKECYKECHSTPAYGNDPKYQCEIGCFVSKCSRISTPNDPRENEVEDCKNSCSDECV